MNFNHMTQQLERQRSELVTANSQLTERRRFMEAVLSGVSAGVSASTATAASRLPTARREKLLGREDAELVGRAARRGRAGVRQRCSARRRSPTQGPAAAAGHADHRRRGAHLLRARDARGSRARSDDGSVLTFDDVTELVVGAAHLGLGRRGAPHRPRDQEPADPDTTLGRAPAPQVRQGHHRGPRGVRALHRHHHPPGRRRDAHGRRVLRLRAHAQAADGGPRHPRRRARRRARPPDGERRHRLRDQGRQASRSSSPATAG